MKSRISILTLILILVSAYFIHLSIAEYKASSISKAYHLERFEQHLKDTPALPLNLADMTSKEYDEWESSNEITRIKNDILDNFNMNTYILWLIRARIHFQIALLSILLTILSWRFDLLNNTKKK